MDVRAWLDEIGLGQYGELFVEHRIGLDVIPDLTDSDLEKLGIPLGDRKRLLKAVARLAEHSADREAAKGLPVGSAGAERRQLTVMFCDLVGSTALSTRLDPEEMREVIRDYQNAVARAVGPFDGNVAKFMGDGVLVYFGYPKAHEDDGERAVRAGLAVTTAVRGLQTPAHEALSARIGIATGLVVVGDLAGEDAVEEEAVVGETPALAARLQAIAEPDTVVISPRTRHLVGGLFEYEDLGRQRLKGIAEPVRAWRVLHERRMESRFEATHVADLTPFVGRDQEVALLLDRWRLAKDGEGQVVLLSGEPGIGKSRIMQTLREHIAAEPHTRLRYQCSPYHTNSALFPIIAQLELAAGFASEETRERKLEKLETLLAKSSENVEDVAPLLAALLSLSTNSRYPPLELTPQRQKEKTLEALIDQLVGLAERRPVLMVFEDAHWIDPTTRELLELTADRCRDKRVLLVITLRPDFESNWTRYSHVTLFSLAPLGRRDRTAMVAHLTRGKSLPREVIDQIVAKTDGVPLFIEELTKAVLESGLLKDEGRRYSLIGPLPPLAIPETLKDSLMARLDRLPQVKDVAQIGAVIGREFSYELVAAVAAVGEDDLQKGLEELAETELVFQRGTPPRSTYLFKHALVQNVAYESLLKRKRERLHARLAEVLEAQFPEKSKVEPEILAHHFTEAGLVERAIGYWHAAGQRASERSASLEAVAHLDKGLALLNSLPKTPERARQELELQLAFCSALIQTKGQGASELEPHYLQARHLCREVGDQSRLFTVTFGLWNLNVSRLRLEAAKDLSEDLLALALQQTDPSLHLQGHHAGWTTKFYLGKPGPCVEHADQASRLYDREQHASHKFLYAGHDPGVCSRNYSALSFALLGYPDQAAGRAQEAVVLGRDISHPFSLVLALVCSALVHQFRREADPARVFAEAAMALCAEQGVAPQYLATARVIHGWATAIEEDVGKGIDGIRNGLDALTATGVALRRSYCLSLLAEAYHRDGNRDAGLEVLTEAKALCETTGEIWWEAEIHRMMGELMVEQAAGDEHEGSARLLRALEIARQQSAKWLELRAAMSLARLSRRQGELAEAREALAPTYEWFTEGFDTPDLKTAEKLLDELV